MPKRYVISIMARDRVGIVADVAGTVKHLRGNIEDMSQTVLRGYFTMILVAVLPDERTEAEIREQLVRIQADAPFEVGIKPAPAVLEQEADHSRDRCYVLTAVAPDRTGLVSAVAEYLRQKRINIEDLATRVDAGRYTMILQLNLPPELDVPRLKHSLRVAMEDLGVRVELQHCDIFRATNEI